jgi:hypothetical protein
MTRPDQPGPDQHRPVQPRPVQPGHDILGRETVAVTAHTVASLAELLGMCEEFLRTAGPLVQAELRTYLSRQTPPADPSWFIDMLGFSSVHLTHLLPATTAPPSEAWQWPDDHTQQHDNTQESWT